MSVGYMRQCVNKIKHESKSDAAGAREAAITAGLMTRRNSHVYPCTQGGHWHVGHRGGPRRRSNR